MLILPLKLTRLNRCMGNVGCLVCTDADKAVDAEGDSVQLHLRRELPKAWSKVLVKAGKQLANQGLVDAFVGLEPGPRVIIS